jgi:hypothetical protein
VCLSALYATCYAWQYENTLSCDVATFTSFFLFEFVNWNSGNVFLCTFFFYSAWSVFLQSHLYLFCNHTAIKLQSRTCLFYATMFFCNRSTSAVCNHTVKDVCNHLYFHQVATTSSKDQSSHINLFTSFFAIAITLL